MTRDLSLTFHDPHPRCRPNLAAVSLALLNAAALVADLDATLRPLVAAAGITDGDVAGRSFAPRFLPTLGRPHAVALRFVCCD